MYVYARILAFGPALLGLLYLFFDAVFSARDRRAERQAGR